MYCTKTQLLMFPGGTFLITLQTFLIPLQKSTFESDLLHKDTGVTSCRCLKVLWSILKASQYPLGSLTKASWSIQNGSKPIPESTKIGFSCYTSLKNRFLNNMLPKPRLATSSWCLEALWSASKTFCSQVGRLRKASWVFQNLISSGQRASKKVKIIFPGCKKQF